MKSKYTLAWIFSLLLLVSSLSSDAFAQGNSKKQGPPHWAPANGYRAKTRHVYFPQHNFYFDMQRGVYIYLNGGNWLTAAALPSALVKIDLKRATQIELDYTSDHPHKHNKDHMVKYKVKAQGSSPKSQAPLPAKAPGNSGGHGKDKGKKKH